jgi:hypothetical protein
MDLSNEVNYQGVETGLIEILQQMYPPEADKMRGHVGSKTAASRADRIIL